MSYGELFLQNEFEMSCYNINEADVDGMRQRFDLFFQEGIGLVEKGLPVPAYDHLLKASHAFNVLDARGAVGVSERAKLFGQMRKLARQCAEAWTSRREELGFPLGQSSFAASAEDGVGTGQGQNLSSPQHFLLEIGSEELPADEVSSLVAQVKEGLPELLSSLHLTHGSVECSGTPRRIYAIVCDLSHKQEDRVEELRGPPAKAAFKDGEPTKAILGFCKKNQVDVGDVTLKADQKGTEYCWVTREVPGKPAHALLGESLPQFITKLSLRKSMRWDSVATYSRPLRWIVAMHGDTTVPFSVAGVASGNVTYGLRDGAHAPPVVIAQAHEYLTKIARECKLIADMDERKAFIWSAATGLAGEHGGMIPQAMEHELLDEVTNLVEYPRVLLGHFRSEFLELPKELLVMVMKKHQRYFPLEDAQAFGAGKEAGEEAGGGGGGGEGGRLLPMFITVANGQIDEKTVVGGNEAVLTARFEDAVFFYETDMKKRLADFRPLLAGTVFQKELGTMLDKSDRTESLVHKIGALMHLDESVGVAAQAAHLSRADLATSTVMEFTALAGVMGKHYALKDGLSPEIAQAVFEAALPRSASDDVARTKPGVLVAVADRLDSLVGLVAAGCAPSTNTDNYGVRRIGYGMLQTLLQNEVTMDLERGIEEAAALQPIDVTAEHRTQALAFVSKRLEQLLVDKGYPREATRAVLKERRKDPFLAERTVAEVSQLQSTDDFASVLTAYSRPTRIVAGKEVDASWTVDEGIFECDEEKVLWQVYKQARAEIDRGSSVGDFVAASLCLVQPLEDFFSSVFVMSEDARVRQNRLAMMRDIAALPLGILDFASLPGF